MRLLPLALILGLASPAFADTRSFPVGTFDRLVLSGSMDVAVIAGRAVSVEAEGAKEALDALEIRVEKGVLLIGHKPGRTPWGLGSAPNIRVAVPALNAARLSGSGSIRAEGVRSGSFSGAVSGSGDLELAGLRAGQVSLALSGSGDIRARGSCTDLKIAISGTGDVDAADLACATADIAISGSGDATARASKTAKVAINGSGDVSVAGGASCTVAARGTGRVNCAGR
ncbi:head GIN domain-containing protein [Thermaurantiacus sp.]